MLWPTPAIPGLTKFCKTLAAAGVTLIQFSNQNSGGTGTRRLLNQRLQANPAYLKDVKAVIWVFSIREFTMGKWR